MPVAMHARVREHARSWMAEAKDCIIILPRLSLWDKFKIHEKGDSWRERPCLMYIDQDSVLVLLLHILLLTR